MQKYTKYRVIVSNNTLELETKVETYLKKGYIPQGGIHIRNYNYFQAMVKE